MRRLINVLPGVVSVYDCVIRRAEPILGSATQFGRLSATRQYSVLGRHKPAETDY